MPGPHGEALAPSVECVRCRRYPGWPRSAGPSPSRRTRTSCGIGSSPGSRSPEVGTRRHSNGWQKGFRQTAAGTRASRSCSAEETALPRLSGGGGTWPAMLLSSRNGELAPPAAWPGHRPCWDRGDRSPVRLTAAFWLLSTGCQHLSHGSSTARPANLGGLEGGGC